MPLDELLALYGYEASDPVSEQESEGADAAPHLLDMTLDKVSAGWGHLGLAWLLVGVWSTRWGMWECGAEPWACTRLSSAPCAFPRVCLGWGSLPPSTPPAPQSWSVPWPKAAAAPFLWCCPEGRPNKLQTVLCFLVQRSK